MRVFSLWIILLVVFIDWMGIGLIYPLFGGMIFDENSVYIHPESSTALKGTLLGILIGAAPLAQFFSGPWWGSYSDVIGRKPVISYSLAISTFGYFLAVTGIYFESLGTIFLSRLITGWAGGGASAVGAAIADMSSPEKKAYHFALYNMACGVGFTAGPFLGGVLSQLSFYLPFLFAGVLSLINLLSLLAFFKETLLMKNLKTFQWNETLSFIKKAMRMKALKGLFITVFLYTAAWSFYWEFIPAVWIELYKYSTYEIGLLYAYGAGFYALSCGLLIRPLLEKYEPRTILFFGLVFSGVFIFLLYLITDQSLLWVVIPAQHFFLSLLFPTSSAIVSNATDSSGQGEALGILSSMECAACAISPLLAGAFLGLSLYMPIFLGSLFMWFSAYILYLTNKNIADDMAEVVYDNLGDR